MVDRRALLQKGVAALGALISGCTDRPGDETTSGIVPPPEPVTLAFIADQGLKNTSRAVLRLIKNEGADLVVHSGDFDYANDPQAWESMLNEELGRDFPYVATIGNHDVPKWEGYQQVIRERINRMDELTYTGDIGQQATCSYKGVTIVQSSTGICDEDDVMKEYPQPCKGIDRYEHDRYVARQLSEANTMWRFCSWHKVNNHFQVGETSTAVPLWMYDTARTGGAIITTGHNHAYARSYPMSSFASQTIATKSPPYTVGNGQTFAVVSGVGGESIYSSTEMEDAEWWANTSTKDDGTFGAFFCTVRPDATGECYFKNIDGTVADGPVEIASAVKQKITARTFEDD